MYTLIGSKEYIKKREVTTMLTILIISCLVLGVFYTVFKSIKTGNLPTNNYTPSDDIDFGRKQD